MKMISLVAENCAKLKMGFFFLPISCLFLEKMSVFGRSEIGYFACPLMWAIRCQLGESWMLRSE